MCYLPIKCLKTIIFVGSLCSIIISLALLSLTVYMQVENKDIIYAASSSVATGALIALYTCSIIFLLLGVSGLAGAMKRMAKKQKNNGTCLLAIFSIGVIVFLLVFMAATIFFFIGPDAIFGNDCTSGTKTTLINDLYSTSQQAYNTLCTTKCSCNITLQNSFLAKALNSALPQPKTNDNLSGVVKFGDCSFTDSSLQTIQILSSLQNLLDCGGWCPLNNGKEGNNGLSFYYYRFRDVNDCTDQKCLYSIKNCHDAFYNFMTGSGRIVGYVCMAASFICFITLMSVCCIFYHPAKFVKGSSFYARLHEID